MSLRNVPSQMSCRASEKKKKNIKKPERNKEIMKNRERDMAKAPMYYNFILLFPILNHSEFNSSHIQIYISPSHIIIYFILFFIYLFFSFYI